MNAVYILNCRSHSNFNRKLLQSAYTEYPSAKGIMISFKAFALLFGLCSGAILDSRDDNESDLAMQNPDLFEGDILGIKDWQDRNIVPQSHRRWPNAVIPYLISPELAPQEPNIRAGMKHYEEKTCIRFVPRTNQTQYINIFAGLGCYSHVGKTLGSQPMSLGRGCYSRGTIVHELGHSVGFFHEHSRSDRDDFIDVHWDNIQTGMEDQFTKLRPKQNILLNPFDYDSIMLYGETVFSKNHYLGLKTMTAKKPNITLQEVSKKKGLSISDIFRINQMYKC